MYLEHESDLFFSEPMEEMVLIHFKKNLLAQLTELTGKEDFLRYLKAVSGEPKIKVALLMGCPEKIDQAEAVAFFRELTAPESHGFRFARIYNGLDQIILALRAMPQFIIHGDCGEILAPFFNISLACDYRIAGDTAVLKFASPELGLIPKGGGIRFLLEQVGRSKTWELLLSQEGVTAEKALEMGLVDRVVPSGLLSDECVDAARQFCRVPISLLSGAKILMNQPPMPLAEFLEKENQVLTERLLSMRFRHRLDKQP